MGGVSLAATDVLFLVDTTGSASGPISDLKIAFDGIVGAIDANSPCPDTIMYGVADYRNYTDGGNYTAYGVNLDQPFTYSTEDVWSAINGLTAGGGVDLPESQLKAMVSITDNWLTTSGNLGFNGRDYAQKIIIWAGDAPGHIAGDEDGSSGTPPTGYYPTLDEVIDALTDQGIIVFALNTADFDSGLNEPYDGIDDDIPPARQQASEITNATGGELFCSVGSGSSEIEDAIVDAINCFSFIKDDDLNDANDLDCRSPEQEIEYSICLTNDSDQTLYSVSIIDWLPSGVDYPVEYTMDPNTYEMISSDPNYDENTHSYIWILDDPIAPDESVCVYLTVVVNENAEPGMYLHNEAELIVGETVVATRTKDTLVCCWDTSGILYVDKNAPDGGSGISWETAYNNLDEALTRARTTQCAFDYVIYVAQGTYAPQDTENGFMVPDDVSIYGGFKGGGSANPDDRNFKKYKTVLTGLIDEDAFPDADTVVTMGQDSLLDGFTVTQAFEQAVYGSGVDFSIANCIVADSFRYGIYAVNGDVAIQWSTVRLNSADGIRHEGAGHALSINNSWILRNGEYGIYSVNSTPTIKNCIVSESDLTLQGRAGIRLYRPTYQPVLHNLTISRNKSAGIFFEDDGDINNDPNNLDYPDLQNSIVYYNNPGGSQLAGFSADIIANFCCIQDCNEPGTTNYNDEPGFAYAVDPNGAPDPNNYHLSATAFCIDKANPFLSYTNQVDMDGEGIERKYGDYVDIGADEVYDCGDDYLSDIDVHNDLDFNADGLVNLEEFSGFSAVWLCRDPNDPSIITDPNYSSDPDYADPNMLANWEATWPQAIIYNFDDADDSEYSIDLADFDVFLDNWLWVACWKLEEMETAAAQSQSQSMMMEPLSMSFSSYSIEAETVTIPSEAVIVDEKTIDEQILSLQDCIEFLEKLWLEEPDIQQGIDPADWKSFMDAVYQGLLELQDLKAESIQIE
jgi:uncharacterized repeat protein (TIGR01451 family)